MDDVARAFPSGHIGSTPQPTDVLVSTRIAGMFADFGEHLEPNPRIDAYLPLPAVQLAAEPGYFRDDTSEAAISEAARLEDFAPNAPTAKNLGGPNLFGDV